MKSTKHKVVGLDPSLRNWGWAIGSYDVLTQELLIQEVGVIQPKILVGKKISQNIKDLDCAEQLFQGVSSQLKDASVVFAEVPTGSRSSRAMTSYGVCVGVLGALRASGSYIYRVTPTEVKKAAVGSRTAPKNQMIDWAIHKHPEANWPIHQKGGIPIITGSKAEHMADAVAAIYAGLSAMDLIQQEFLFK